MCSNVIFIGAKSNSLRPASPAKLADLRPKNGASRNVGENEGPSARAIDVIAMPQPEQQSVAWEDQGKVRAAVAGEIRKAVSRKQSPARWDLIHGSRVIARRRGRFQGIRGQKSKPEVTRLTDTGSFSTFPASPFPGVLVLRLEAIS